MAAASGQNAKKVGEKGWRGLLGHQADGAEVSSPFFAFLFFFSNSFSKAFSKSILKITLNCF
jgi:hypothetical protein